MIVAMAFVGLAHPRSSSVASSRMTSLIVALVNTTPSFISLLVIPTESLRSDQLAKRQLVLDVGVVDRRRDQAGNAEGRVHHEHGQQQLPRPCPYARADDAGIHEVLQLVDNHQETSEATAIRVIRSGSPARSRCWRRDCRSPAAARR